MKTFVARNLLQSARVNRQTWMVTAINLTFHPAIKTLSCFRIRRVYQRLEKLFCNFLWFCALIRVDLRATNRLAS